MKRKAVVFENLTAAHILPVFWYWALGYSIYYLLTATNQASQSWWFRKLTESGRLSRLSTKQFVYTYLYRASDLAFDTVDEIYDRLYRNNRMVKKAIDLYQSESVHLATKKLLLFDLQRYIYYRLLLSEIGNSIPGVTKLVFVPGNSFYTRVPSKLENYLSMTQELDLSEKKTIQCWPMRGPLATIDAAKRRVRISLVILRAIIIVWNRHLRGTKRNATPSKYEFAVAFNSPQREFSNEIRGVDFLLDSVRIRKDNTLFINLVNLGPDHWQQVKDKGLVIANQYLAPSSRVARKVTRSQIAFFVGGFFAPNWLSAACARLADDFALWSAFAENYQVADFVTSADFGLSHIGRNIILSKHKTQTWYYVDSVNSGEASLPNAQGQPYRAPFWGFLKYDYCVSWNQRHIDFFKSHKQDVGEYFTVGPLWSEHIRLLQQGQIRSQFKDRLVEQGWSNSLKLVSIFDTSFTPGAISDYEYGVKFLADLERLAKELPGIFLVYKEKKPRWLLGHDYHSKHKGFSYGIEEQFNRLNRHPRFFFPGFETNPSEILALTDLAISVPFTSTTVEALGAGGKGIYHDPDGRYKDSFSDQIHRLVSHSYEELYELVEDLLFRISDEEYGKYLHCNVKGVLDPYLDGQGLSRFRNLLCSGGRSADLESREIGLTETL